MKRLLTLVLLMSVCLGAFAQASWLKKYEKIKGIERVYISGAMLNMVGLGSIISQGNKSTSDKTTEVTSRYSHAEMLKRIGGILILESGTETVGKIIKADCENIAKNKNYELLMSTETDGEISKIFILPITKGDTRYFKEMLLFTIDKESSQLIQILGNFSEKEIQQLAK